VPRVPERREERGVTKVSIETTIVPAFRADGDSKPSGAFRGELKIWMVPNLRCRHCRRELRANDITADVIDDDTAVKCVCSGCHRDIFTVENS
jgi:hypothetical protein